MNRPFDPRDVLFLIPAYNEEGNLGTVLAELHREFPTATLLVIDDGSIDRTAAVARAHGAIIVTLPFNMGIGAAIQTGIAYALAEGFHWVLRLDGDGQHDPGDIHRFFDHLRRQPADLLIGSRFLSRAGFQSSRLRRLAIGFLCRLIRMLTGFRVTDATSGFHLYSRRAMQRLCRFYPDDYPEPEVIIMLYKWKMCVDEVPVTMRERSAGMSSITFLRSGYYMIKVTLAILIDMIRY
ncbi:MAG TPA: glycosyltransferase family 2 protein [Acidobacteriota bacterium]|nr:glycosyltransferase family 2 protein [Acidobacteriota bacterium]HQM63406.1 glycosyltransferase family 2 protein [Acidobacteriota bacterium]